MAPPQKGLETSTLQQLPALETVYQALILIEFKEQLTIYLCYEVKTRSLVPEENNKTIPPFTIHAFTSFLTLPHLGVLFLLSIKVTSEALCSSMFLLTFQGDIFNRTVVMPSSISECTDNLIL